MALIESVKKGDLSGVKDALSKGADINSKDHLDGWAALHYAADRGHQDIVEALLDNGAEVNIATTESRPEEYTAVMLAAKKGHKDVILILIQRGANQHIVNKDGWTALHYAAYKGYSDIVETLLDNGADINIITTKSLLRESEMEGYTSIMLATKKGHKDIVLILTQRGATLNHVNKAGKTAIFYAIEKRHTDVIEVLLQNKASVDIKDMDNKTPFEYIKDQQFLKTVIEIECRVIFRRGLDEGYVYITSLKLVLLGPPCVGKTAFKSLLFNWPAPKKHHSTAISTRPIRGMERVADKKEGKIWLPITGPDLLKMLSDAIRDLDDRKSQQAIPPDDISIKSNDASIKSVPLVQYENVDVLPKVITTKEIPNHCTSQSYNPDLHSQEAIPTDSPVTKPSELYTELKPEQTLNVDHSLPDMSQFTSSHIEITKDDSSQLLSSTESISHSKEMIDLLLKRKTSEQLHKAMWIHVLDSGGQPQFADVSRFFLHGNAIHVICTKLTESLFDKPCFCYSLDGKMLHEPSELKMTNLELIESFVRSVMSSKNIVASTGKMVVASKPLFVIVGTNYDKFKKQFKKQSLIKALREKNTTFVNTA